MKFTRYRLQPDLAVELQICIPSCVARTHAGISQKCPKFNQSKTRPMSACPPACLQWDPQLDEQPRPSLNNTASTAVYFQDPPAFTLNVAAFQKVLFAITLKTCQNSTHTLTGNLISLTLNRQLQLFVENWNPLLHCFLWSQDFPNPKAVVPLPQEAESSRTRKRNGEERESGEGAESSQRSH